MVKIIGEGEKNEARITIKDGENGEVKIQLAFKNPPNLADPEYTGTRAERLAIDAVTFIKGVERERKQ